MELSHPLPPRHQNNAAATDTNDLDDEYFEKLKLQPKAHIDFEGRLREHAATIENILRRTTRESSPDDVSKSIQSFLLTSKVR